MLSGRQYLNNILLCMGLVLILPACVKRRAAKHGLHSYYEEQPVLVHDAQYTDIPLPVQTTVHVITGSTARATGLTYISLFASEDLIKFYELEMERLGWKQLQLFTIACEVLLVFEKPEKLCTISIRPDNRVVLFFGQRF